MTQVEFYFSDENLPTDAFLLKQVSRSPEGWGAPRTVCCVTFTVQAAEAPDVHYRTIALGVTAFQVRYGVCCLAAELQTI